MFVYFKIDTVLVSAGLVGYTCDLISTFKNKTLNNGLDNMFTLNTCCTLAYQMGVTQNKS